ncbi:transcriptional regulator, arac family protein [Galbibacter marinus]|uniref:Transcriptional regulator, arac family protein n=1 Tax=Galbibacter marinus TaxID=555500 RepID=K2QHB8_9FLAO|nr:helix-turn-helix domain-containing protein [Galbibacter marinus]EKF54142.1 transcriptional regulator, arac family protein [Galbibacter marinus]
MEDIITFNTIKQYCDFNNNEALHPLAGIIDLSKAEPRQFTRFRYNFYIIFFKEIKCGDLRYGCNYYDYEEGTLVFLAPGQVIGENKPEYYQPKGFAMVFHPDFILGTSLGQRMQEYTFFNYEVNEALHLSIPERDMIKDIYAKVNHELEQLIDKHTKNLVISNIELFLNYCVRFYDRQFITRTNANQDIIARFEKLLNDYFHSDKAEKLGLPSVTYCAEQLFISPNYLGDMIKKETGKSPQEHIQLKLISIAKERIFDPSKSISEIAYQLGFKYPQHFSKMFKKVTGTTPNDYRLMN